MKVALRNSKLLLSTLLLTAISVALVLGKTGPSHDKVVVCYISTWAVYRPGEGSYALENFDANLCTHAVYAFAGLDVAADTTKSLDAWQDLKDNYGKGGYERLTKLKETYPHLKVTLAIGGWNEGSANYSMLAADPTRRRKFVVQTAQFVRKFGFDGLDLDWEYPTQRGGVPADKQNFVALVSDLRQEFDKFGLILTSAIGAAKETIDNAYDIPNLARLLDYLHIMCYDYGGSWDKRITANSPLKSNGVLSVEYTIDHLLQLGAPPSKIVMGLPFYGRTFITKHEGKYEDPIEETGFKGPYTRETGFLGYNEICEALSNKTSGWTTTWDDRTSQGIAKYRDPVNETTQVATYDTPRSIARKVRYAMAKGLAGAMVWAVDTDDFLGKCDEDLTTFDDFKNIPGVQVAIPKRINSNYPLLRTINEAIVISLDEIEQERAIKEKEKENEIPREKFPKKGSSASIPNPTILTVLTCIIVTPLWLSFKFY